MKLFILFFISTCIAVLPASSASAVSDEVEWSMYNKNFAGQRHSPLDQIHARNAASLREVCRIKLARGGSFHTGPIVSGGILYATTARLTVAIDARNCSVHWRSVYVPEQQEVWATNRGLALLNGRLFRGTADGRVLALDAATGRQVWRVAAGNPARGEFFSSAPIAWNGLVFMGIAGGDWGIRGRMMAFDAASGKEAWRFNTVPMPGEAGAETWERTETARHGGGGTWGSYALDIERGEVFVPVANPAPDFAPAHRPGANLFTNSVLVLDAATGKLKWWYQVAPSDSHDYGIGAGPMLYRLANRAEAVALAAKDGHVYVIDRVTQRLLFRTAVTTIENAGLPPTPEGRRFCPGVYGGTEWNGPAFDPALHALFVGAVDWCSIIKTEALSATRGEGSLFMGGSYQQLSPARGWVTSLDADTGRVNWRYQADAPVVAGVTPTAGGVVFAGDMAGNFLALDSRSGKPLHKLATGGAIAGGIVTYAIDGRQYVATTSGNVSRATLGALGSPTLIILALPRAGDAPPRFIDASGSDGEPAESVSKGSSWGGRLAARFSAWAQAVRARVGRMFVVAAGPADHDRLAARGKSLFAANCAGCHGADGSGIAGPSLRQLHARLPLQQTIETIKHPKPAMPALYPSLLSEQDVRDVASYVQTLN